MIDPLSEIEIRDGAVELANLMRTFRIADASTYVGIYSIPLHGAMCEVKTIDLCQESMVEGCFRILDRIIVLRNQGLTAEAVRKIAKEINRKHGAEEEKLMWPMLEMFRDDGVLADTLLEQTIELLAAAEGVSYK